VEAAQQMMFNARLDAVVALVFMGVAVMVIVVSIREWILLVRKRKPIVMHEAPFVPTALGLAGD
jgi:carbon starvation protein